MSAITDVSQVAQIMSILYESNIKLVKIDVEKLLRPKKWGWRFVAFDLRMDNGQICEYYITFEKLASMMWDTHRIYERWRQSSDVDSKDKKANKLYLKDLKRSQTCYSMAFLTSLTDKGYSATSFLETWIQTMTQMVTVFSGGDISTESIKHVPGNTYWFLVATITAFVLLVFIVVLLIRYWRKQCRRRRKLFTD